MSDAWRIARRMLTVMLDALLGALPRALLDALLGAMHIHTDRLTDRAGYVERRSSRLALRAGRRP